MACRLLELTLFIFIDVCSIIFCEGVNKNGALSPAEKDNRSIPTRFALSWPCNPLFNDATAEIGIHQPFFRASYSLHQDLIAKFFFSSKALEPPCLEDSWAP